MNKLTRILLYLVVFTIPFENTVRLPVVESLNNLLTLLLVIIAFLTIFMKGEIKKPAFAFVLLSVFLIFNILSFYWSDGLYTSFVHLIIYFQLIFISWVIFEFIDTEEKFHNLLKSFVFGCIVILVQSLYNYVTNSGISYGSERFVIEGYNANGLGIIWVIGVLMAVYLTFNVSKKFALYIPLAIFMILLTASRTALILLVLVLIASTWYLFKNKIKLRKTLTLSTLVVLLLVINFVPEANLERLSTIEDQISSGDLNGRTAIWESGMRAFKDNPILGAGTGQFNEVSAVYATSGREDSSHNSYLSILVENGMIGFLLFGLFLITLFIYARNTKSKSDVRWLTTILIILWLTLSFVSHAELQKYTWVIFGIIISGYYTSRLNLKKQQVTEK